ncbi:hypothetical protein EOPP23_10225 [Endozoicomonas sp. OPT23]|uniref:hypothetical protein n=1 Tax=Endozoicomonas sp. OPT23 TaxID=2072845 RepID=UPI00129B5E03|nr:hypothetical protein [Endozoicomonas sp. OPT23]MRI33360.1 hypothetical protein [Endozoicomonas sp. OPT23]
MDGSKDLSSSGEFLLLDASPAGAGLRDEIKGKLIAKFKEMSVKARSNDEMLIPRASREVAISQPLTRTVQRVLHSYKDTQKVCAEPFIILPNRLPEEVQSMTSAQAVFCSDQELLADLNIDKASYLQYSDAVIKVTPTISDIKQTSSRSSCFLLASLASYAASPTGQRVIASSINHERDHYFRVTLFDPILEQDTPVIVSSHRLLNSNNQDIFSFRDSLASSWPGLFEKAYLALMLNRRECLQSLIQEEVSAPVIRELNTQLELLPGAGGKGNPLDYSDARNSLRCLPEIQFLAKPLLKRSSNYIEIPAAQLDTKTTRELIKQNLRCAVPVVLGKSGSAGSVLSSLTGGTSANHVVAAIALGAGFDSDKRWQEGIFTFDPYGDDDPAVLRKTLANIFDSQAAIQKNETETSFIKGQDEYEILLVSSDYSKRKFELPSSCHCINFIPFSVLKSQYSQAVIARGGISTTRPDLST